MIKILHLCLGLYNFWTTYEGEYINESLMSRKDVDVRIWGPSRIGYVKNMSIKDVIRRLYGPGDSPDVTIVHASMAKIDNPGMNAVFSGMEDLHKSSIVVWKTCDTFGQKQNFYIKQINKYRPQIVLNWYKRHVNRMRNHVPRTSKVIWFPHSVGRRYYNKNEYRKYDLALIGRCSLDDNKLSYRNFNSIKVFVPPKRKTRPEKGNNLINDLNKCRFSWNSPVKNETGLRFVETPACGTISMVPYRFDSLNDLFPKDCYLVCNGSIKKAQTIIKSISNDKYLEIQQKAYKIAINNHSMNKRIQYLLDVIKGHNVCPEDYFEIKI